MRLYLDRDCPACYARNCDCECPTCTAARKRNSKLSETELTKLNLTSAGLNEKEAENTAKKIKT